MEPPNKGHFGGGATVLYVQWSLRIKDTLEVPLYCTYRQTLCESSTLITERTYAQRQLHVLGIVQIDAQVLLLDIL